MSYGARTRPAVIRATTLRERVSSRCTRAQQISRRTRTIAACTPTRVACRRNGNGSFTSSSAEINNFDDAAQAARDALFSLHGG
jgi:hypothetical protein